jgi:hypothetical protein
MGLLANAFCDTGNVSQCHVASIEYMAVSLIPLAFYVFTLILYKKGSYKWSTLISILGIFVFLILPIFGSIILFTLFPPHVTAVPV